MKKWICIALLTVMALAGFACAGTAETAAEAGSTLEDVLASFELGEEMMTLTEEDLSDIYGIEAEDMVQFAAAVNSTGIKADEIVLVEAVDDAAATRVKEALDNRFQSKLNELDGYLPEEYAVTQACSVEMEGCFVSMIVAPNAADLVKLYNERIQ